MSRFKFQKKTNGQNALYYAVNIRVSYISTIIFSRVIKISGQYYNDDSLKTSPTSTVL